MAGGKEWAEKRRMCLLVEKKGKNGWARGLMAIFSPYNFLCQSLRVINGLHRAGEGHSFLSALPVAFLRTQLRRETYGSGVLCVADAERTKNGYAATHSGRQNNKTLTLKYWTKLVEKKQKKNVHR